MKTVHENAPDDIQFDGSLRCIITCTRARLDLNFLYLHSYSDQQNQQVKVFLLEQVALKFEDTHSPYVTGSYKGCERSE